MSVIYLLLIILIVLVFYALIPLSGAFFARYKWRQFRNYFNKLRLCTLLDYRQYRQLDNKESVFHFSGEIESITDGITLWVRGDDMLIPVSLENAKCYLLHVQQGEETNPPMQIRTNTVCTLTEGAKVFVGGVIKMQNNRLSFCSTKNDPLLVIFYNSAEINKTHPDQLNDLPSRVISSSRTQNDYWNNFTPISIIIGALSLIYFASSLLGRPAFSLTVICAIVAVFIPILPLFPPGLIFTTLFRRIISRIRKLRANRDLLNFGLFPYSTQKINSLGAIKIYIMEAFSWLILLAGITTNIVFIFLILFQFEVISF
jgi:hypothetical protein